MKYNLEEDKVRRSHVVDILKLIQQSERIGDTHGFLAVFVFTRFAAQNLDSRRNNHLTNLTHTQEVSI